VTCGGSDGVRRDRCARLTRSGPSPPRRALYGVGRGEMASRWHGMALGGYTPRVRSGWLWGLTITRDHDFYIQAASAAILVHNCSPVPEADPLTSVPADATARDLTATPGIKQGAEYKDQCSKRWPAHSAALWRRPPLRICRSRAVRDSLAAGPEGSAAPMAL
jgi:hypothetical protein